MGKLAELWKYQQVDLQCDKQESALRNTPTFRQLNKLHAFLEEKKKEITKLTDEVDQYARNVETAKEQYELAEKRYKEGLQKYETIDKEDVDEVARFRKYFENIHGLVISERKEFMALVSALNKTGDQLDELRKKVGPARKEYQELKAKYDQEREGNKSKFDELTTQLKTAAKTVDKNLLERYRAVKRSTSMPVARVNGNECGGCMMQLSAVLARKLKESDDIIECENCGRLLYLE